MSKYSINLSNSLEILNYFQNQCYYKVTITLCTHIEEILNKLTKNENIAAKRYPL